MDESGVDWWANEEWMVRCMRGLDEKQVKDGWWIGIYCYNLDCH